MIEQKLIVKKHQNYYDNNWQRIRNVQKKYRELKRKSSNHLKKLKKQNHDYYINSGYFEKNYERIRNGQKKYRELKSK